MIRLVKLDKKENYLIDSITNKIIDKYDPYNPDLKLVIQLEDSVLTVDADKIKIEYGNQIVVDYNDERFIIDDGYQDILIKAGYVIYKNYDKENIFNKEEGINVRSDIMDDLKRSIKYLYTNRIIDECEQLKNTEFVFHTIDGNYQYTIIIDTVNSIVSKNQERKDNSLPFYPFLKSMDKYGTVYISIFAKKISKVDNEESNIKFKKADDIVKEIIKNLGSDYHFSGQKIKRRLIRTPGI